MARVFEIRELVNFLKSTRDKTFRAYQLAILQATIEAEGDAKKNAARLLPGTIFRPKSGNLVNAIFSLFRVDESKRTINGGVGVRAKKGRGGTRPYGRAHEFGATIEPVKALWLWIPIRNARTKRFENLTPGGFVTEMKRPKSEFTILDGRTGDSKVAVFNQAARFNVSRSVSDLIVLFALKKRVELPERPYVRPAVAAASLRVPALFALRLKEQNPDG